MKDSPKKFSIMHISGLENKIEGDCYGLAISVKENVISGSSYGINLAMTSNEIGTIPNFSFPIESQGETIYGGGGYNPYSSAMQKKSRPIGNFYGINVSFNNSVEGNSIGLNFGLVNQLNCGGDEYHKDFSSVGLNIGLVNEMNNLYGLNFGIKNRINTSYGVNFGLVNEGNNLSGVNIGLANESCGSNNSKEFFCGANFALATNNLAGSSYSGISVAGLSNSVDEVRGLLVQASVLKNSVKEYSSEDGVILQFGLWNKIGNQMGLPLFNTRGLIRLLGRLTSLS